MMRFFTNNTQVLVLLFLLPFLVWSALCADEAESTTTTTTTTTATTMSPMDKTEQEALYSAIQGFVGKWWNGSDLYPDPCGWTPIQGVSCDLYDGLWYVTVLNIGPIHDNYLGCTENSEFRWHLFELKYLKTLSFFNCFLSPNKYSKSIPSQNWEKLGGTLESLEFRSNPGLIGQIPLSFGSLTKLRSLVLLENGLTGELPVNLGNLVSLKRLVLAGNKFTGKIPPSLGGLSELLIFDSSRNYLFGSLPNTFGGLTSLLKLDLSNNFLNGKLPSELGKLKHMILLDLRNNRFSGGLTQSFQEMVSLEEMALSNNPIGGDLMDLKWEDLQNLESIDLTNMGLTGEIPESMTELKKLRFLGLSNNSLSGKLPPKLASLPCVGSLYINGNNLTGELAFSEWFYGKMGRRFGAWNNPNLCYPIELMPTGHVPFGVKPCQQGITLMKTASKTDYGDVSLSQKKSTSEISLGFSIGSGNGSWWWVSRVAEIVIVLLLNLRSYS